MGLVTGFRPGSRETGKRDWVPSPHTGEQTVLRAQAVRVAAPGVGEAGCSGCVPCALGRCRKSRARRACGEVALGTGCWRGRVCPRPGAWEPGD